MVAFDHIEGHNSSVPLNEVTDILHSNGGNGSNISRMAPFGGLAALIPDVPDEGEGSEIGNEEGDESTLDKTSSSTIDEHNTQGGLNQYGGAFSTGQHLQSSNTAPYHHSHNHQQQQQHQQYHHHHHHQQQQQQQQVARPASTAGPSRRDSMGSSTIIQMTENDGEDDSDAESTKGEKRSGRRKIQIAYIEDKSRRHITFSKRKAGIMKKAYELSTLTGTQVLLLVASETGHVYTFATPKLQPLITKPEGKNLIQACLNAPDPTSNDYGMATNGSHYGDGDDHTKDSSIYDDRSSSAASQANSHQNAAAAASYAAAMANLAGFPYPGSSASVNAASAAFLNAAANFPTTYAQYNAALAAGFWPGAPTAPSMSTANAASNALASAAAVAAAASLKNGGDGTSTTTNPNDKLLNQVSNS